jgi:hypothetical protein
MKRIARLARLRADGLGMGHAPTWGGAASLREASYGRSVDLDGHHLERREGSLHKLEIDGSRLDPKTRHLLLDLS